MKRLVSLVYLVYLVELETNQMNKTNQMNQINSALQSRSAILRMAALTALKLPLYPVLVPTVLGKSLSYAV